MMSPQVKSKYVGLEYVFFRHMSQVLAYQVTIQSTALRQFLWDIVVLKMSLISLLYHHLE